METVEDVAAKVHELDRLRRLTRLWRVSLTVGATAIAATCVFTLFNAVQGLTQPGPRQQEFVSDLSDGLKREVVPNLQSIATQSFNEMRPQLAKSFSKANEKMPELAQASLTELNTLQQEVPQKSEAVVRDTFSQLLKKKEPKLKEMFPNASEEQIATLVQNLSEQGQQRIVLANDSLFSPHMAAMNSIAANMEKIRLAEKPNVQGQQANWELGLDVLDLIRDDLKDFEPKSGKTGSTNAKPAAVAAKITTKSQMEAKR